MSNDLSNDITKHGYPPLPPAIGSAIHEYSFYRGRKGEVVLRIPGYNEEGEETFILHGLRELTARRLLTELQALFTPNAKTERLEADHEH